MIRAESELVEIAVHVPLRHMDMCRRYRLLEHPPERLDAVDVVHRVVPVIVMGVVLLAVRDRAVLVAVAVQ